MRFAQRLVNTLRKITLFNPAIPHATKVKENGVTT